MFTFNGDELSNCHPFIVIEGSGRSIPMKSITPSN